MSAVFESETLGPTERLVMLALADHADDAGRCYPSIARICQRTGLSERAIQMNVKKLSASGHLTVVKGGGKANTNIYIVNPNPAPDAPFCKTKPRTRCTPQEMHPAPDAPQTPHLVRPNPAPDAPEPSGTIIDAADDARATDDVLFARVCAAAGRPIGSTDAQGRILGSLADADELRRWTDELHLEPDRIVAVIRDVMGRRRSPEPVSRLIYFRDAMREAAARAADAPLTPAEGAAANADRPRPDRRQAAADAAFADRIAFVARARPASS